MTRSVYDTMINAPRTSVALGSFHLLSTAQDFRTPGIRLASATSLALLLCEHYKVDPQDAFTVANNLMNDHDDRGLTDFEAIRLYMKEEM